MRQRQRLLLVQPGLHHRVRGFSWSFLLSCSSRFVFQVLVLAVPLVGDRSKYLAWHNKRRKRRHFSSKAEFVVCVCICCRCPSCDGTPTRYQDLCGNGFNFTLSNPQARTFNRDAEPGSDADNTKHHPWRAPGSAPVLDVCGVAGGTHNHPYNTDGAMCV